METKAMPFRVKPAKGAEEKKPEPKETKKFPIDELVGHLFHCRDQVHIWHFATLKYNEHVVLGKFYDKFIDLSDTLIESIQGAEGTKPLTPDIGKMEKYESTEYTIKYIDETHLYLEKVREEIKHEFAKNTIDEMVTLCQKTKFLLQLV